MKNCFALMLCVCFISLLASSIILVTFYQPFCRKIQIYYYVQILKMPLLSDERPNAVVMLSKSAEARPLVMECLNSKDIYLVGGVAWVLALMENPPKNALPKLINVLEQENKAAEVHKSEDVDGAARRNIIWAIKNIGGQESALAIPALKEATKSDLDMVKEPAQSTLEEILVKKN